MKDNLNIEELFQDKFNSFEGEVSPDAWANIQQGMAAGAAGTTAVTGMSLLMKGVIAGGIVAATVTSVYLFSDSTEQEITPENDLVVNNQVENGTNNIVTDQTVQGEDLPNNTIDGSSLAAENVADQSDNDFSDNNGPENNGVFIPSNGGMENAENGIGEIPEDSNNDGTPSVDESGVVLSPINDSTPGTLDPDPVVKDHISSNPYFEAGDEYAPSTYVFHANAENARSVEWLFEDGTVLSGEDVEFTFEKPGKYSVSMTAYGEGEVDHEVIEVVIKSSSSLDTLPNIITPNGDRKNDFFAIAATDIETFEIIITDAQGVKVYESTDVNFRWNGTNLGGEQLLEGDYYYTIFAVGDDGSEFRIAMKKLTLKYGN
ncbi:MAG: T9SS type B sorting domain-containing protein [Crocinitomix sp.]|nr:T9SS type B sorting domain-containing protein [Crocinitomix sp.]